MTLLGIALGFGVLTLWPQIRIGSGRGVSGSEEESTERNRKQARVKGHGSKSTSRFGQPTAMTSRCGSTRSQLVWERAVESGHSLDRELLIDLCESIASNADGNVDLARLGYAGES